MSHFQNKPISPPVFPSGSIGFAHELIGQGYLRMPVIFLICFICKLFLVVEFVVTSKVEVLKLNLCDSCLHRVSRKFLPASKKPLASARRYNLSTLSLCVLVKELPIV